MQEVQVDEVARAAETGATVLDVREVHEYVGGHVAGAVCMPMGQVAQRLAEIRHDAPVYVICASGHRSAAVTDFLRHQGVDAYNVAGGTNAWVRSGRPVETGTSSGRPGPSSDTRSEP